MLTFDQWLDVLGYLAGGSISLLLVINTHLRRQRREQREAFRQQIQELEKRLDHYDQYTTQVRADLARYQALVENQRSRLETLSQQLDSIKKFHWN
jgi:septal ring factor EnvC (AmiA/AmiB activator)